MTHPRSVPAIRVGTVLAALLFVAPACFWHRKPASAGNAPRDVPEGEIALQVTNHNFLDVTIYVLHNGQRTRVGTVTLSAGGHVVGTVPLVASGPPQPGPSRPSADPWWRRGVSAVAHLVVHAVASLFG